MNFIDGEVKAATTYRDEVCLGSRLWRFCNAYLLVAPIKNHWNQIITDLMTIYQLKELLLTG